MALFEGRILITDCSDKDDRDAVIANILNHRSSRATLYIMVKDFEDVQAIRRKFPTVVPFLLIPGENIEKTRRMLKLLPHMDHFVNFLGQNLALEFLNKRSEFRIKSVSRAYARSSVIDKILESNEKGIIFNINTNDNPYRDNVVLAGSSATKSIKGGVRKMFQGLNGPPAAPSPSSSSSSIDENSLLLSREKENKAHRSERAAIDNGNTANDSSSGAISNIRRFIVSLYYFICPCINETSVVVPVAEYPVDLDAKLAKTFEGFYESMEADWHQKITDARHAKEKAIKELQSNKEERVEKEYNRLIATHSGLTSTASNRFQAYSNVRNYIRVQKDRINQEYERKTDLRYFENYYGIVEDQFEMLVSFWKKVRLTP